MSTTDTDDDFDLADCAAQAFGEPAGEELPQQFTAGPWQKETAEAGINMRLAAIVLGKTKPELIEVARRLGQENLFEMLDHLEAQEKRYRDLAELLGVASARLLVAGAAVIVGQRGEPVGFTEGFGPIL